MPSIEDPVTLDRTRNQIRASRIDREGAMPFRQNLDLVATRDPRHSYNNDYLLHVALSFVSRIYFFTRFERFCPSAFPDNAYRVAGNLFHPRKYTSQTLYRAVTTYRQRAVSRWVIRLRAFQIEANSNRNEREEQFPIARHAMCTNICNIVIIFTINF